MFKYPVILHPDMFAVCFHPFRLLLSLALPGISRFLISPLLPGESTSWRVAKGLHAAFRFALCTLPRLAAFIRQQSRVKKCKVKSCGSYFMQYSSIRRYACSSYADRLTFHLRRLAASSRDMRGQRDPLTIEGKLV